jgi:hypothetical protein
LSRLAPALAAAVLVGAPLATLNLAGRGAGHARKAPANASSREVPFGREGPAPARPRLPGSTRAHAPASARAEREQKPAAPAAARGKGPSLDAPPGTLGAPAATAAGARPTAAEQPPSGGERDGQSAPSPPTTAGLPPATPPPGSLPTQLPASAPAVPLPSVAGVTQQLGNTAGQVRGTVTAGTGALLEAGRAASTGVTSALPATQSLP